jgi:hypothetical protein
MARTLKARKISILERPLRPEPKGEENLDFAASPKARALKDRKISILERPLRPGP